MPGLINFLLALFTMRILYTAHAKGQLAERKIEEVWIEEAIKHPDLTVKDGGRTYVVKKINSHTLKVVYVMEKYINVVTCYFLQ
jgi:hypothetical protein